MPQYYPVMLDIYGRSAIVIGGDRVAAEKVATLAASGAHVSALSPQFCDELRLQAEQQQVTLRRKAYEVGDLADIYIVVAVTNDPQQVQAIWTETQGRGQLVNIVDVPAYCTFIMPSVLRRGQLTLAVSTEGASPALAKHIRQSLEEHFPHAYDPYVRLAALVRTYLRQSGVFYEQRDHFFNQFFASDVLAQLVEGNTVQAAAITAGLLLRYGIDVSPRSLVVDLEKGGHQT